MIFNELSEYDSSFFTGILKKIQNPNEYYPKLKKIVCLLKTNFPGLRLVIPPTQHPVTVFIQGILLPTTIIQEYHLAEDEYESFGLHIFAIISEDFQKEGITVYDSRCKINWDKIPIKIRHCRPLEGTKHRAICTHHFTDINKQNCVLGVLNSAYYLYQEYKKYDRTKKFDLECHEHRYSGSIE